MVATKEYLGASTTMVRFGDRVQAFLATPKLGEGPFPAIILGHERYGLVQHTLDLAAKFASYGYVAIAPDLYSRWDGDKAALERGDIMVPVTDADVRSYMSDSLDYLLQSPIVEPNQIGAMGVCLSGAYPLLLNSIRGEIAANIVVYGGTTKDIWQSHEGTSETFEQILDNVAAPIIGIWGEDDFVVSVSDVLRMRNALEERRKSYEFTLFRGMPHGWFNTTMPGRYRPRQTDEAWLLIIDFLERVFRGDFVPDRAVWKFASNIAVDYDFTKKVRLA